MGFIEGCGGAVRKNQIWWKEAYCWLEADDRRWAGPGRPGACRHELSVRTVVRHVARCRSIPLDVGVRVWFSGIPPG